MAANSSRKKSPIWEYFQLTEDTKYASCKSCDKLISQGGDSTKVYNTTNLVNHLKSAHNEAYKEYQRKYTEHLENEKKKQEKEVSTTKQLSLTEVQDRGRKWDINDVRAQRVHKFVMEMIALDNQPFSLVEDTGFVRLLQVLEPRYTLPSRKYLVNKILPVVHDEVMSRVKSVLKGVTHFSFTTDVWSAAGGCSLTAHWLTELFDKRSAVLHVQPLQESHTGEYLGVIYKRMLDHWEISIDKVHLVLRDNAANMIKAMREASLPSLGCFAHSLQLFVEGGVLLQRAVTDVLATCRTIFGHFKHSSIAYSRLRSIQERLEVSHHRLQQDVRTRWNSSLYMVKSVIEQKMSLAAYATETGIVTLSPTQLDLADKIVAALSPIKELTKSISADCASVSVIIPFVKMLSKTLQKHHNDSGVRTMKNEMLHSLNRRFCDIGGNQHLVLASLLDPRFKNRFFDGAEQQAKAKEMMVEEVRKLSERSVIEVQNFESGDESHETEPASKHINRRTAPTKLWKSFEEIIEESGSLVDSESTSIASSVEQYLSEPLIEFHRSNCYDWWRNNKARFPQLARLAQQYLAAPPTSIPSERVFSGASDLYDEKRNHLNPEKAEVLLFIKNNFNLKV